MLGECLQREVNPSASGTVINRYEAGVYPNPTSDRFRVSFTEPALVFDVALYDVAGRLISREVLDGTPVTEHFVKVDRLPAGVYQLVMETDGLRVRKQVVVL